MNTKAIDKESGQCCTLLRLEESDLTLSVSIIERYGYEVLFDYDRKEIHIPTRDRKCGTVVGMGDYIALFGHRFHLTFRACEAGYVAKRFQAESPHAKREASSVIIPPDQYKALEELIIGIYQADPEATQKSFFFRYPDGSELSGKVSWKIRRHKR